MRIQFAAPLKDRFGEDLRENDPRNPGKTKIVSLGDICCFVLDQEQGDRNAKEKVRRWELILAITKADKDLSPLEILESDIDMIKNRLLESTFSPSICGSAIGLLTPATELDEQRRQSKQKA